MSEDLAAKALPAGEAYTFFRDKLKHDLVVLSDVPMTGTGGASGALTTVRQVGSALGVSVIGTLVTIRAVGAAISRIRAASLPAAVKARAIVAVHQVGPSYRPDRSLPGRDAAVLRDAIEHGARMRPEVARPEIGRSLNLVATDMAGQAGCTAARPGEQLERACEASDRGAALAEPGGFQALGPAALRMQAGQEAVQRLDAMLIEGQRQRIARRARQAREAPKHFQRLVVSGDLEIGERAVRLSAGPGIEKACRQAIVVLPQRLLQPVRLDRGQPISREPVQQRIREAMGQHVRHRAAMLRVGEQPERPALLDACCHGGLSVGDDPCGREPSKWIMVSIQSGALLFAVQAVRLE